MILLLINCLVALSRTLIFNGLFMNLRFDLKSLVVVLLIFSVSTCASPPLISEINRLTSRTEQVEIIRDEFGVPNIIGRRYLSGG